MTLGSIRSKRAWGVHRVEHAVAQRFEAKYLITEVDALAIREFIEPYMTPDPRGPEYPVTSLYLDSPDLKMFWSSETGEKNRYKLRVRWYDPATDHVSHFEVKQRIGRVILKHRSIVRQDLTQRVLSDRSSDPDVLADPTDSQSTSNLHLFQELAHRFDAGPQLLVRYIREAYVSDREEPVRITLDRGLESLPCRAAAIALLGEDNLWHRVHSMPVILEVKFTNAFPKWVKSLVQRFELTRISLAKYTVCVSALRREGIYLGGVHMGIARDD